MNTDDTVVKHDNDARPADRAESQGAPTPGAEKAKPGELRSPANPAPPNLPELQANDFDWSELSRLDNENAETQPPPVPKPAAATAAVSNTAAPEDDFAEVPDDETEEPAGEPAPAGGKTPSLETQLQLEKETGEPPPKVQDEAPAHEPWPAEFLEAVERFRKERANDLDEHKRHIEALSVCHKLSVDFAEGAITLAADMEKLVRDHVDAVLDDETHQGIHEALKSGKSGLNLLVKMLKRLPERRPKEDTDQTLAGVILADACTTDDAPPDLVSLKKKLKTIGDENYRLVSQVRNHSEKVRNEFFSFLTSQFFPIVDGARDGRRHFNDIYAELRTKFPGSADALDAWFSIYAIAKESSRRLLKKLHVEEIAPSAGDVVDYEKHEAMDTVDGGEPGTETVEELVRPGYVYTGPHVYDVPQRVLRSALVVVRKG